MSRGLRFAFGGYVTLVLLGIGYALWPLPQKLFRQWEPTETRTFDFGPLQSSSRANSSGGDSATTRTLRHGFRGPVRVETEIALNVPRSKPFSVRALAADDEIYFASGGWFYAVGSDGDMRWSFRPGGSALGATRVLIADKSVFISSDNGSIYGFDRKTGRLRWLRRMADAHSALQLAILGSQIFVAVETPSGPNLRSISAENGEENWTATNKFSTSVIGLIADGERVVAVEAKTFSTFDANTGRRLSSQTVDFEVAVATYASGPDVVVVKSHEGSYRGIEAGSGKTLWTKTLKVPTANWMSQVVPSAGNLGFWSIRDDGLFVYRDVRTGRELETFRSKHKLIADAAVDTGSLVAARADGQGLVRIR